MRNQRNPVHWARRQIRTSTGLDSETKGQVLRWLERLLAMTSDDPRQQAVVATACIAYAQVCRYGVRALSLSADDPAGERLASTFGKWQLRFVHSLRMAGLATRDGKPLPKRGGGSLFTAPRPDKKAEAERDAAAQPEHDHAAA